MATASHRLPVQRREKCQSVAVVAAAAVEAEEEETEVHRMAADGNRLGNGGKKDASLIFLSIQRDLFMLNETKKAFFPTFF